MAVGMGIDMTGVRKLELTGSGLSYTGKGRTDLRMTCPRFLAVPGGGDLVSSPYSTVRGRYEKS